MEQLKKLPISKLIFFETYSKQSYYSQAKGEVIAEGILVENYGVDKEKAKSFIRGERETILQRGSDLNSFLFDKNFEDTLEMFYQKISLISSNTTQDKVYSDVVFSYIKKLDFTWSEYLILYQLLSNICANLKLRMKKIKKEYRINLKKQWYTFDTKSSHNIEVERLTNINIQLVEEIKLIEEKKDFYEALMSCIFIVIANSEILIENLMGQDLFNSVLMKYILYEEKRKLQLDDIYINEVENQFYNKLKHLSKKR